MSGPIVRTGSNEKLRSGWDRIFGGGAAEAGAAKADAKPAGKKTAAKKAAKPKKK